MKTLLYTTTAFVLCGGIVQANAACIATPSCTAMGYTSSSSCTNGIKCPFGEYWNCDLANKIAELEKKIEQQEQDNALKSCAIGNIFYSDMSCSVSMQTGKTPIGVVVYTDGQGHGQVLALKSIGSYTWGPTNNDIPTLTNFGSAQNASYDLNSCPNTEKIIAAGDKSKYPAAWAAYNYQPSGTPTGKRWCLPAAGVLNSLYNNLSTINTAIGKAGGTKLVNGSGHIWSSSEYTSTGVWIFCTEHGADWGGLYTDGKRYGGDYYVVRPVLAFQVFIPLPALSSSGLTRGSSKKEKLF